MSRSATALCLLLFLVQPAVLEGDAKEPIGDVAFMRDGDIYTATLDGKHVRCLTTDGRNAFPIWSPDGRYIAFSKASLPVNGAYSAALCIITPDGRYQRTLKEAGSRQAFYPLAWLPRGNGLTYNELVLDSDAGLELGVVYLRKARYPSAPVSQWSRAIKRRGLLSSPPHMPGGALAFSPSGRKIIFEGSTRREPPSFFPIFDLYTMNTDGSRLQRVARLEHVSVNCLRWHPSSKILSAEKRYRANLEVDSGIWLRDSNGRALKKLAEMPQPSLSGMDWSPKGDRIVYQLNKPGYPRGSTDPGDSGFEHPENFATMSKYSSVWIMNADGSGKRRLASNTCHPNWR